MGEIAHGFGADGALSTGAALALAAFRATLSEADPAEIEAAVQDYLTENPPVGVVDATTSAKGIVELATNTEATTGTDTARAVTPAGVKAVVDALTIPDSPDDIGAAPATHDHTAAQISNSTATGRAVLTAADAATARGAIGAGTSSFDGAYSSLSGTPTLGTAAAADTGDFAAASHSHPVGDLTATGTRDSTTYLRGDGTWATPAGGGGGVTDHGALTGLGDDDHTQYALADGSRGSFAASSHTHPASEVSDSTATGRSVLTAASQAAARTAIGAGTSNLTIGTTAGTAAAGNRAASTTATGMVELATNTEATTGTDTARAVTPSGVKAVVDARATDYATAAQGALADTALQVATAQPINARTGTTYTLQASDAGKLVTLNNTGAITLNAPGSVFTAGQRVDVLVLNTGMATVVGTSGATANGTPTLVSRARYSAFTVVWLSATSAVVVGDMAAS